MPKVCAIHSVHRTAICISPGVKILTVLLTSEATDLTLGKFAASQLVRVEWRTSKAAERKTGYHQRSDRNDYEHYRCKERFAQTNKHRVHCAPDRRAASSLDYPETGLFRRRITWCVAKRILSWSCQRLARNPNFDPSTHRQLHTTAKMTKRTDALPLGMDNR